MLILTRDNFIPGLNAVTVAPLTTKLRGIRTHVALGYEDGLAEPSEVNLDQLLTVPKRQLQAWIATLSNERMREVTTAIALTLGFDRYED